jgi:exonuclease VII large subunit
MSTVENNIDKFRCETCNKSYKDKSGIWYHNKKFHKDIYTQKSSELLKTPSELLKTSSDKQIKKLNCNNCEKIFSRIDNLKRHKLKCNKNKSEQISKDETIDNLQKQLDEVKKTLMEIINKKCKIHPKTLQKINKQLNIDNNGIINENNGTINNNNITYNVIGLGHENLTDVFSKKEKLKILKHKYCSLLGSKEP